MRAGRADYYSNLTARFGVDFGIAKHLEGAFFWNLSATTEDVQAPAAAAPASAQAQRIFGRSRRGSSTSSAIQWRTRSVCALLSGGARTGRS